MTFPTEWKFIINSGSSQHQPDIVSPKISLKKVVVGKIRFKKCSKAPHRLW
jgi:hypothetical protein